ncbi:MAG: preprotein translocase subunit SecE [Deltaproteobacteria bacterium]|nr:MAG: preprotein translocase subunit SecE [Deltaproteobacteria bacterium]
MAHAQDNAPNKPVHLMFLFGGMLFFLLLQWTIDWIWGYFVANPSEFYVTSIAFVVALAVGISLYRNERVYTLANEVATELKKVAWPNAQEVKAATIVVVIMTIISAAILGLFDMVWAGLTEIIYG